jgi:hypothetical protein
MSRVDELSCEFVITIPDKLAAGTLYVSMEYATVVHRCCCGCGNEVVTPLSPTDWKLTYDGEGISLHPSIGNWSFKCRSHYWIRGSAVQWAGPMSDVQVKMVRQHDVETKAAHFGEETSAKMDVDARSHSKRTPLSLKLVRSILKWFRKL